MSIDTSIIVPIYNTAEMIKDSVNQITNTMDPLRMNYEILLRDDGSTDGSREVLKQVAGEYPEVKYFYNPSNKGLGSTLRKLLRDARGDKIVYCDCDLPFGVHIIPVLLKRLKDNDIVVASRYRGALNSTPFARKACSRFYYFLCRLLFNIPIADIGSGSVAMRSRILDEVHLKANGFDIHAEFYVKASKKEFRIKEMPVEFDTPKQGSFHIWEHGPDALMRTFKLYFESLKNAC